MFSNFMPFPPRASHTSEVSIVAPCSVNETFIDPFSMLKTTFRLPLNSTVNVVSPKSYSGFSQFALLPGSAPSR
jgi:hypothetical protein